MELKKKNKISYPRKPLFFRKREKIKKQKIKRKKEIQKYKLLLLDKKFVHFLSLRRKKFITLVMRFFSLLGDGHLWLLLCLIFFFIDFFTGLTLTVGLIVQVFFQQLVKRLFLRQRPYEKHVEITKVINPPDRFSFPSGHTTAAFTIVFIFYYIYPVLFFPFLFIAIMIGFSRIYLGLHYPSDVIAGIGLGFICAKIGIWISVIIENIKSLI